MDHRANFQVPPSTSRTWTTNPPQTVPQRPGKPAERQEMLREHEGYNSRHDGWPFWNIIRTNAKSEYHKDFFMESSPYQPFLSPPSNSSTSEHSGQATREEKQRMFCAYIWKKSWKNILYLSSTWGYGMQSKPTSAKKLAFIFAASLLSQVDTVCACRSTIRLYLPVKWVSLFIVKPEIISLHLLNTGSVQGPEACLVKLTSQPSSRLQVNTTVSSKFGPESRALYCLQHSWTSATGLQQPVWPEWSVATQV